MSLAIVTEWLARIEHKLDAIMRHQKIPMPPPMHFIGSTCPACGMMIDYQVDFSNGVVIRRCDCKTGKVPSTIPLIPVSNTKEKLNGSDPGSEEGVRSEPGGQRKPR